MGARIGEAQDLLLRTFDLAPVTVHLGQAGDLQSLGCDGVGAGEVEILGISLGQTTGNTAEVCV